MVWPRKKNNKNKVVKKNQVQAPAPVSPAAEKKEEQAPVPLTPVTEEKKKADMEKIEAAKQPWMEDKEQTPEKPKKQKRVGLEGFGQYLREKGWL